MAAKGLRLVVLTASAPEPYYRLARVFEAQGLLENALEEYNRALELSHGRHVGAKAGAARVSERLRERMQ